MATDSPMSNFNRKNPYVIQAKQKYNEMMELYEEVTKMFITTGTTPLAISIVAFVLACIVDNVTFICLTLLFIPSMGIITYFVIKNTIKDSINKDIDKMVTLESNEIMEISIEYVQELIYNIHECIGKIKAYIIWYKLYSILISISSAIVLIDLIREVVQYVS